MRATHTTTHPRPTTQWETVRRALLQRRQELATQMYGELARTRRDRVGGRYTDVCDQADESFYGELAQGFAEIAAADLRMIDLALERIAASRYGRCEDCGRRIPAARLRALPFADLCVECKKKEEAEERLVHRPAALAFSLEGN